MVSTGVFGLDTAKIRMRPVEPSVTDRLIDAINASGYGLTLDAELSPNDPHETLSRRARCPAARASQREQLVQWSSAARVDALHDTGSGEEQRG